MGIIMERVKQFFEADQWAYAESEIGLKLNFGGRTGTWRCLARVREDEGQFLFYSFVPLEVPAAQMPLVAEYLMRANFGLFIGNFELNYRTGTVQYRTSIDVEGDEEALSLPVIKHLVYQNVLTMDKYLPGLQAVIEGRMSPEAAIEATER